MLSGSSNFLITHSVLVSVDHISVAQAGTDILYHEAIHEAAFDSYARDPPPRCHAGSREDFVSTVVSWALIPVADHPSPLLWIEGDAGTGKSALAQTCIEELKNVNTPLVAFFFSRSRGWNNHRKFFLTIAYQLATQYLEYRALLDAKIRQDKSLLQHKSMASQLKELIIDPLLQLEGAGKGLKRRIPIFVDALDECDTVTAQSEIVQLVANTEDMGRILCWVFLSRPATHIEKVFALYNADPRRLQILVLPSLGATIPEAKWIDVALPHRFSSSQTSPVPFPDTIAAPTQPLVYTPTDSCSFPLGISHADDRRNPHSSWGEHPMPLRLQEQASARTPVTCSHAQRKGSPPSNDTIKIPDIQISGDFKSSCARDSPIVIGNSPLSLENTFLPDQENANILSTLLKCVQAPLPRGILLHLRQCLLPRWLQRSRIMEKVFSVEGSSR